MNTTRSATSREADLMRDDHHGHSLAGQRAHHVEDLTDQFGIERRCRSSNNIIGFMLSARAIATRCC